MLLPYISQLFSFFSIFKVYHLCTAFDLKLLYTANTVEAATARAIDAALTGTAQYGAVSDIVKSFQNGGLD
jgi:hypothetical protein